MRNLLALLLALLFCFSCVTSYAEGSRESSPQESVLKNGDYEYVVDEDGNAKLLSYSWDSHIFAFSFPDDSCDKFNPDDEYFLGPIVTYKNERKLEIIDGQQRLTTLMLMLRAFYTKFLNMKDDNSQGITTVSC